MALIEYGMHGVGLNEHEAVSIICFRCKPCDMSSMEQSERDGFGTELVGELESQQLSEVPKPIGSNKQPTDAVSQKNGNSAIIAIRNRYMTD